LNEFEAKKGEAAQGIMIVQEGGTRPEDVQGQRRGNSGLAFTRGKRKKNKEGQKRKPLKLRDGGEKENSE